MHEEEEASAQPGADERNIRSFVAQEQPRTSLRSHYASANPSAVSSMQQQLDTCLQALSSLTERHEALDKRSRMTESQANELVHSAPGAYK